VGAKSDPDALLLLPALLSAYAYHAPDKSDPVEVETLARMLHRFRNKLVSKSNRDAIKNKFGHTKSKNRSPPGNDQRLRKCSLSGGLRTSSALAR